jgi:RHS repeat-associated protein
VYDSNGNLTFFTDGGGTTNYTWDARNRMTAISGPGVAASFVYDGLGRQTAKNINSVTNNYQYDGHDITRETGGSTVTYLRGLNIDEPFVRQGATNEYYHAEALGSAMALTDGAGASQTTYRYEPFGNTAASGTTTTNPFQYTNRENDGTGLYYLRARYYSPKLQRFVSEDPIGLFGGDTNLYAYVLNNPTRFVDPLGLDWFRPPSDDYIVGRDKSKLVRPGEGVGKILEDYVPAMHTLGEFHDALVDMGLELGLPDWLINISTMPGVYIIAVEAELYNSVYKIREKMRDRDHVFVLGRRK